MKIIYQSSLPIPDKDVENHIYKNFKSFADNIDSFIISREKCCLFCNQWKVKITANNKKIIIGIGGTLDDAIKEAFYDTKDYFKKGKISLFGDVEMMSFSTLDEKERTSPSIAPLPSTPTSSSSSPSSSPIPEEDGREMDTVRLLTASR